MRILIADDHKITTEGLTLLLEKMPDLEIVGTVLNGKEVLKFLKKHKVDLILMDINMPKMNGIETTFEVKQNYPDTKVLIVSMHNKEGYVKNAAEIGADGYILKNAGKDELELAIDYIKAGKTFYSHEVTQTLVKQIRTFGQPEGINTTPKERLIIKLISEGHNTKDVAKKVGLKDSTVQTYRKDLIVKFGAKNFYQVIKIAIDQGYI